MTPGQPGIDEHAFSERPLSWWHGAVNLIHCSDDVSQAPASNT